MTQLLAGSNATPTILYVMLQGIVYGFSTCMFGMTVWILGFRGEWRSSRFSLAAASLMWLLPTARVCVDVVLIISAFTRHADDGPGNEGPEVYLSQPWSTPGIMADDLIYAAQTLLGDAMVIYRCYVCYMLWGKRWWVIVIPSLAWLGAVGSTVYICWAFQNRKDVTGHEIFLIYIFTFISNLTATLALAYRIWRWDRDTAKQSVRSSGSSLRPVAVVFIESGALYSVVLILGLISTLHDLPLEFTVNGLIPALISIAFNMIFMRRSMMSMAPESGGDSAHPDGMSAAVFSPGAFDSRSTELLDLEKSLRVAEDATVSTRITTFEISRPHVADDLSRLA